MLRTKPVFAVFAVPVSVGARVLTAIDLWVGRTLFVPLIVRFCQRFKWTQFHVHNYLYMVGSCMLLVAALGKGADDTGLTFLMALAFTLKVGRNPGYQGVASTFLRRTFLLTNVIHIAAHVSGKALLVAGPNFDLSCPVGLMFLFAEYARTIKTIPPLERDEPVRRVVGEIV